LSGSVEILKILSDAADWMEAIEKLEGNPHLIEPDKINDEVFDFFFNKKEEQVIKQIQRNKNV